MMIASSMVALLMNGAIRVRSIDHSPLAERVRREITQSAFPTSTIHDHAMNARIRYGPHDGGPYARELIAYPELEGESRR